MNNIEFKGGKMRMEAFQKLKVFIANPGKFCLIILGDRGTGKHFAIEKAFAEIRLKASKALCISQLKFIHPSKVPSIAEELDELFKENQYQTIVVEDVELLTEEQQELLFTSLSTSDGMFGIKNKFNIRLVFTSSKEIEGLRESDNYLKGLFWDRISQLIVEFPSFKIENEHIVKDFQSTWNKMKFQKTTGFEHFASQPKNATFEKFLEDFAEKFEGGFRDLDKLACMYFNYRILFYGKSKKIIEETEKRIVDMIKIDFIGKSQLHNSSNNDLSFFQIQPGFSMDDLNAQFRIQVRKWAHKEYGTLQKAGQKLLLKPGTIKNYVEGKATKKQKNMVFPKN